jgi:hypothetical protein
MSDTPSQYDHPYARPPTEQRIVVTDIDMTIGAMCRFMVKWAIASIPAALILLVLYFICAALVVGCGMALSHH